jgi:hypothetical protein
VRARKQLLVPLVLEVVLVLAPGCGDDETRPIDAPGAVIDAGVDALVDAPIDTPIDVPDPPPMD